MTRQITLIQIIAITTNSEAPNYASFYSLVLNPSFQVQTSSSAPCSRTPTFLTLPSTKDHTEQKGKIIAGYFNLTFPYSRQEDFEAHGGISRI